MTGCIAIGKILGHRFRARFSVERTAPDLARVGGNLKVSGFDLYETRSCYECDVCERCGAIAFDTSRGARAQKPVTG